MSTLAQKLLDIKKQRDTELGYKLKQLAPYVDAQYKNKLKEETEAYELQSGTDMIKQQAAGLGYKDFEPEGDTLQQREQSWNTFKINQSLSAESGAAGYVPPTDAGFYEKKAGLGEFKETKKATAVAEGKAITKKQKIESDLKSLGSKLYKEAQGRIAKGEDAEIVYGDLKQKRADQIYWSRPRGSKSDKPVLTAYGKRFNALGLDPELKHDTIYYKVKEKTEYGDGQENKYYEIPVVFDEERGWLVEENGMKINPDYKWTKKPTGKTDVISGIAPGINIREMVIPEHKKRETKSNKEEQPKIDLAINPETKKIKRFNPVTGKFE